MFLVIAERISLRSSLFVNLIPAAKHCLTAASQLFLEKINVIEREDSLQRIALLSPAERDIFIKKLLKQLSTTNSSDGWDGTYNQEELPSTDYWFTLDYTENGVAKQFKAHFSLKR